MRYKNNDKYSIDSKTYKESKADGKNLMKADVRAARELQYPSIVIKLLENEPDQYRRQRILSDARNGKYDRKIK